MPSTTVIVTGIRRIDRKLKVLPLRLQKKVIRQAMRGGLKLVAAETKAEAPVDTGTMKRATKVGAVKRKKRGTIELEVRIKAVEGETKRTSAKTGKTVFYPAIVEYGKKNTPPNPFMRRAYDGCARTARDLTRQLLLDGLNREIKALAAKS